MQYAPILVTVYARILHLRKCIESLKACPEAKESILYVASDAASTQNDEQDVNEVRDYLKSIKGFKDVYLILRGENLGSYQNSQEAKKEVYLEHDRLIRLEDDVIVGKGFLYFINRGLDVYKDDSSIVGICGYLPPSIWNIKNTPFFLDRIAPYGFGRWREKDRIFEDNWNANTLQLYFSSFSFFRDYERKSPHAARVLPLIVNGDMMPGDIVTGIIMQANGLLALYPPHSLTKSIGNDGTGVHSGVNIRLQNQVVSDEYFEIPADIEIKINKEVERKISNYRRTPGVRLLNYCIYFLTFYIPLTYKPYKLCRIIVKKIRNL